MDIYSKDRKAAHVCSHYRSPIVVELVNISITISVYSFVNQGRVSRVSGWGWGASHVLHMRDIRYNPEESIKITSLFDCIAMSWPSCRFALYLMYSENCQSSGSMGMACLCRVSYL